MAASDLFDVQFAALMGHKPFCWQRRLFTKHFLTGALPAAVDLPTGLGKTSVMAIWYLALKAGAPVPRRLVYVVDRRAVVDQATTIADEIKEASDDRTLHISTLRGQHVDNRAWLEDPAAPAIIVGTIDMIGSRLLFSGYGVSRRMRPYHAGFLGSDTLLILDEAHLCPPFEALLKTISHDREEALGPCTKESRKIVPHFRLVSLSATGREVEEADSSEIFRLTSEDYKDAIVMKRLSAAKRLTIENVDDTKALMPTLAARAWTLGTEPEPARVIVYCNSRDDAVKVKEALDKLLEKEGYKDSNTTQLLVGARRVHEREGLFQWLETHGFVGDPKGEPAAPTFLVATSAGEVGVDLDADHMVCDLVEWERMVQRLGRVNRRGRGHARINVIAAPKKGEKVEDSTERLARLRAPLSALPLDEDGVCDASPSAIVSLNENAALKKAIKAAMTTPPLRPALTRALVDAWSLTGLEEHTGRPDVQPWLRGWVDDEPQTTVVWRRWLPWREGAEPPIQADVKAFFATARPHLDETLETETYRVFDWLAARAKTALKVAGTGGEGAATASLSKRSPGVLVLDRSGELIDSFHIDQLAQLADLTHNAEKERAWRPWIGRTLVAYALLGGLNNEGMLDQAVNGEPRTLDAGWDEDNLKRIGYCVVGPGEPEPDRAVWKLDTAVFLKEPDASQSDQGKVLRVFVARGPAAGREGDLAIAKEPQPLNEHGDWACEAADEIAEALKLPDSYREMLKRAAKAHDDGKARPLWQNAMNAPRVDRPFAKTTGGGDWRRLNGYRHEFGSLKDVEADGALEGLAEDLRELALHLIAAHHGHARPTITPFDPDAPPSEREKRAREIALRFARLQRRWGPWGLTWWEALLRAADWRASKRHGEGRE